jgi:hypothetical protein
MSWITNLFKKKPKRLPARDHIGRFLFSEEGSQLFNDSPVELIEKAKAKALKKDKEVAEYLSSVHNVSKTKPVVKKPVVKKAEPKTAKAPVAKKTTSTTAKKATPKKK